MTEPLTQEQVEARRDTFVWDAAEDVEWEDDE